MRTMHAIAVAALLAALTAASSQAADEKPAAAPAPADTPVKVLEIKGKARFRIAPDAPWQTLTMDSPVSLFTEFQTASHSEVKLQVGPNSTVVLKGLGTLTIASVNKDDANGVIQTRLGQKYGRVHVEVQHVGEMRNDYTIATPGMVMAVKGSGGDESSFGPNWSVDVDNGNFNTNTGGQSNGLTGGDHTNNNNPNPNDSHSQHSNVNNNFYPGLTGFLNNNDPHNGYGGNNTNVINQQKIADDSNHTTINNIIEKQGDEGDGPPIGPPPPH